MKSIEIMITETVRTRRYVTVNVQDHVTNEQAEDKVLKMLDGKLNAHLNIGGLIDPPVSEINAVSCSGEWNEKGYLLDGL